MLSDTLAAAERTSTARGQADVDLSLLVDGLRAEREQGITIDVAYRYFATEKRTFILADTPGHVQYTRNTVTGASTADVIIILVDARTGVVAQTRRHVTVAALLGVPEILLAVNKIDLVDYDQADFDRISAEFAEFATGLGIPQVVAIPISALQRRQRGDPLGSDRLVLTGRRCWSTWSPSTSRTGAPSCRCGSRSSTSSDRDPTTPPTRTTAATRDGWRPARCGRATPSWCCPAGHRTTVRPGSRTPTVERCRRGG